MINRVLVAGRLVEALERTTTPGGTPLAVLTLELQHPSWGGGEPDICTVKVHAVGEGLVNTLDRYLKVGEDLLVEGQLREVDQGLAIKLDHFRFMQRNLTTRYLWHEASLEKSAA